MAIKRTSPDIWQPALVDKIAELVGEEIINMWYDDEIPHKYDEEKLVETAIDRVAGKIRLLMPCEVYDRIYNHAVLDDYIHDLNLCIEDKVKSYTPTYSYQTSAQKLAEVGMSMRDFI